MPHILIVEDEPAIADTLIYALTADGHSTHWTTLAGEAVAYLQDQGADLVIMDVGLPDQNGFEACKRVRLFSEVPVLFLTARGSVDDRVKGLESSPQRCGSSRQNARTFDRRRQMEMLIHQPKPVRGYVNLFYLVPEAQGQGIGAALHAYFREFMQGGGARLARLSVSPSNVRALAYYRKQGWSDLGPRPEDGTPNRERAELRAHRRPESSGGSRASACRRSSERASFSK